MEHELGSIKATSGAEADYRSLGPIRVCPCGSEWWNVQCKFDTDFEIGMYGTTARCVLCDSLATVVTPIDREQ
jgi:hypothetical protein